MGADSIFLGAEGTSGQEHALTENRMTATVVEVAGHTVELGSESRAVSEHQAGDGRPVTAVSVDPALALLLGGGALCNDALLEDDEGDGPRAIGDPTEGALVVAAAREGLKKPKRESALPALERSPSTPSASG